MPSITSAQAKRLGITIPKAKRTKRRRSTCQKSKLGNPAFLALLKTAKLPEPVMEHQFHATRKWRFDYAWLSHKIALEVEGGVWTGGRHTRASGFIRDMDKYNAAALDGWLLLRVTPDQLATARTVCMVRDAIAQADERGAA